MKFSKLTLSVLAGLMLSACTATQEPLPSNRLDTAAAPLRVAVSPYQDIAMFQNEKLLGLEDKYGTKLELVTMAWDDILPAIASAGQTADVGFGSLVEYLEKLENLNSKTDDPVMFIYPAYVFKGGGFISFNKSMPDLTPETISNRDLVKKFLTFRFGIQKHNVSEMVLFSLARRVGFDTAKLHTTDITLNDSLLATENGSLDASWAGLTQRTEALKRHGRIVLTMETVGLADITGFVCKASTLKRRRKDIEAMIRMWFDCTDYVFKDLDHHTAAPLAWLKANASTQYTLPEYKKAITQECFPTSIAEAKQLIVDRDGKYSSDRIAREVGQYLVETGAARFAPPPPKLLQLADH